MNQEVTKIRSAELLSWGVIELQVTDLDRAVAFWCDAIGLVDRHQQGPGIALGTATTTLIVLHSGASRPVNPRHTGMYHVAIGVPDQAEFSRVLARLITKRIPVSPTDHLASKSIYFADPDGLEIELILETPERFGKFGDLSRGLILYDVDGNPHSGREALDVEYELSFAKGADVDADLSDGGFLAHVHFKVGGLEEGNSWFEQFGFTRSLMLENWGFSDMGVKGGFAHRLAMNIWAGPNMPAAPDDMARMVRYELRVHDAEMMDSIQGLQAEGDNLTGIDPMGVQIALTPDYHIS